MATRSTRRATSTTQYGDHARWELLRAAGIGADDLRRGGVGPVTLENTIRYLRAGDEVDVTCAFEWSEGRTFRVRQEFPRPAGELAAELTGVGGLLDLRARRLLDLRARRLLDLRARRLVDDPKARRRPHPSCWVSDRRPRIRATMARLGMWTTRSSRFAASRSSSKAFPCCET
ncbi:acyl-CoA thioesterase [Nonomuraea sp. C10]|uniref:acyl-CoA thioesterase n=1 Tax=Nonomuraea sp. C10 TaxID=2600577 RepID=UPI0021C2761D|nr:acyl-CoA thioesterase [Nonomuraea sp. C10]